MLIFIIFIQNKKLSINGYKVKCAIGKRGIKNKKREGDLITPKGSFKIKYILYRNDRISNLPTKIKKIKDKSLFIESNPSPVKYAASLLNLSSEEVRLPLVKVTEQTREIIIKALKSTKLI